MNGPWFTSFDAPVAGGRHSPVDSAAMPDVACGAMLAWMVLFLAGAAQATGQPVELRGRSVCLDETGQGQACAPGDRWFGLQTPEGSLHRFLPADPLAAIFQDARVRDREVVVRARLRPDGAAEIIKVYSVRQGRLHDVHYFCDVCNITAYAPGLCPCCRKEMDLREDPVP